MEKLKLTEKDYIEYMKKEAIKEKAEDITEEEFIKCAKRNGWDDNEIQEYLEKHRKGIETGEYIPLYTITFINAQPKI